jgi:hypothetical protein
MRLADAKREPKACGDSARVRRGTAGGRFNKQFVFKVNENFQFGKTTAQPQKRRCV